MEKLRIGVIGAGLRGGLALYWHKPEGESEIVALADLDEERQQKFQERLGSPIFLTKDYKELLVREDIDAIAVLSPDYLHEEHVIAALEAGKHVYSEKPLAITVEGCDRIIEVWKKSGKHLMVGFNMRYMSMYQTMKGIIDSGAIGELKTVWVRHFVGFGGYFYYHDWHANSDNTTSLLLQKGSHDLDVIHWITGKYTKKVSAIGGLDYFGGDMPNDLTCPECSLKDTCPEYVPHTFTECAFRKEVDVEDNNMLIMELEGGVKASYLQCHFTPDYERNYTFIGTKGRIENDDVNGKVYLKTRKTNTWNEFSDVTYDMKPEEGSHGGADPKIAQDFVELVLRGKEPLTSPFAGRMSVAVGCAATESIRTGGGVVEVSQTSSLIEN
ncbi:Gfo/Idh/MocA family protein [Sporosarcina gallistercoris]|uniref:Gfo/Idh/MocA family oxidoreductase n=1 Tax=Sporosarcina gallistercoris TaxID=2762245 RepID=A0ABR8PJ96_9BACL|nr:Gfo/Idh/MocA family oxidoreductase [Sporosarcina gallistercoris]MBD7908235.1 Gfo/Idh/MocA family oxidoreductase [Sporosarcina gallistercoris]